MQKRICQALVVLRPLQHQINILIKMVFNRTASSKNFICDNEKLVANKEYDQDY